ncbi:uncharacterized protein K441DRAFT_96200 [Cenococcum geophilum 1.58]|uniref:uncharacterized protein n=1 Tax=Cenococcum geophilum 1.58 TaxID=794803 RepID=UPI00358DF55B|nr:hypothetical protein K441DRAFT_96200 [Cenococcum geophilum 1.58]
MVAAPEVGEARGGRGGRRSASRAAEGAEDVGRAAQLHARLRRQPSQLEPLAGGGDGIDAERGAVREGPAEELGVPGSCDGLEGEDGVGDGNGDWVFWFEGGLELWGEAGVDEEVVDIVSDLSGRSKKVFLGGLGKPDVGGNILELSLPFGEARSSSSSL